MFLHYLLFNYEGMADEQWPVFVKKFDGIFKNTPIIGDWGSHGESNMVLFASDKTSAANIAEEVLAALSEANATEAKVSLAKRDGLLVIELSPYVKNINHVFSFLKKKFNNSEVKIDFKNLPSAQKIIITKVIPLGNKGDMVTATNDILSDVNMSYIRRQSIEHEYQPHSPWWTKSLHDLKEEYLRSLIASPNQTKKRKL